jgi:hypothetical protein
MLLLCAMTVRKPAMQLRMLAGPVRSLFAVFNEGWW